MTGEGGRGCIIRPEIGAGGYSTKHNRLVLGLADYYLRARGWAGVQPLIEQLGQVTGERVILADEEGTVVGDSGGELLGQPLERKPAKQAYPITMWNRLIGTLYLGLPRRGPFEETFLSSVKRSVIWAALLAGGAGIALTLWLSRRILRPVQALTAAARRMQESDLDQRVAVSARDEIGELARAFNAMAAGLKRQEELRRQMVSDVAHELRTPLANVSAYLEALRDGLVKPTPSSIGSLYAVAQEAGAGPGPGRGRATGPAAPAGGAAGPRADSSQLHPLLGRGEGAEPQDRPGINLLKNAVNYTPTGGEIAVSAARQDKVRDTGEGISPSGPPLHL